MTSLATAFVDVKPRLAAGSERALRSDAGKAAGNAGKDAGKQFKGSMGGALKGLAGVLVGAFAVTKGISFFKDSIAEARESQKVGRQTAAVLKSTGGVANVTAKQIGSLATAISNKTGIDDEQIQSNENMLLTFKNVRNEAGKGNKIFSQATQVVTDMSAALGQSGKSSAIQLGKALNDPIKGITALSRVGVTFDDGQKKQIATLVKHGQTLKAQKIILKELNSEFKGSAAAQATPAEKAAVAWSNFKEAIGKKVLPILDKLETWFVKTGLPAIERFGGFLENHILPIFGKIGGFIGKNILPTVGRVIDAFAVLFSGQGLDRFADELDYAFGDTGKLAEPLGVAFGVVSDAIQGLVGFMRKNKAVVATFVGVLGGFLIINDIVKAVAALNVVLAANPIGIVVVALAGLAAGLVYAYKHSETFRKVVQKAFAIVKQSIQVAWQNVIHPALKAFAGFITGTVAPAVSWLWKHVVKPGFQAIGQIIGFVWRNIVRPLFKAWKIYMTDVLFPVIRFLWKHIVKPAFEGIGAIVGFMWRNVVKPLFRAWKAYLTDVLFPVIRFLWKNVIKPAFEGIGHVISFVWRNAIKPTFNNLKDGVSAVRSAFRTAVDAIGRIWNGLKQAAMAPVRFIVNTVYENGIRRVVNAIPGVHDLPKLHLNRGGPVFGGTPGRDSVDAKLTPGEHVWTASEVAKAGGHGAMYAMRKAVQHFAKGGAVWPTTGHRVSSYPGHDGADINGPGQDYGNPIFAWRSGKITYAGWGRGYGHAIFEKAKGFPTVVYGHGSAVYVHTGQNVRAGQTIGRVGSTGHSTGPHLHFGVPGGTYAQALALLSGAGSAGGGGGGGAISGYSGPSLGSVLKYLTPGRWSGALRRMGGWGSMLSGMVGNLAGTVRHLATSRIHAAIKAAGSFIAGSQGPGASLQYGAGARAYQRYAFSQFGNYGWGASQRGPLLSLWNKESGWNPHARNPSSGAYGIPQALPASKIPGGYASTPGAQIRWGLGYIKGRYGSPSGAWGHELAHNWYDTGGMLPSGGMASNRSGRPERVLNPRQTESFDRLVALLERGGLGGAGVHIDTVQTYDVHAAARAIRAEQMKATALMGSA